MPPDVDDLAGLWSLDPTITFLNHGSFGATPVVVQEEQQRWRRRLEAEPVRFLVRELPEAWDRARDTLAAFVGARPADLVLVPNATTGINTALASFPLRPGDRILRTDHGYNACNNAADRAAEERGIELDVARIPFPLRSSEQVISALVDAVVPRTRLALVDHVTSATGMVLPIRRIVAALADRGVETVVDGAHAPGMLPLDVGSLGAAFYAGNAHKWLCAPKGAGFLWVREDLHPATRPRITSHGFNAPAGDRSRLHAEFDWAGTTDPSPYLCIPSAIRFLDGLLEGGWDEVRRRNRALALRGRRILADALGAGLPCPDEMVGSLATVELPAGSDAPLAPPLYLDPLQERLWTVHRIEVPVVHWPRPPERWIRISAQLYNGAAQVERLADALRLELGGSAQRGGSGVG